MGTEEAHGVNVVNVSALADAILLTMKKLLPLDLLGARKRAALRVGHNSDGAVTIGSRFPELAGDILERSARFLAKVWVRRKIRQDRMHIVSEIGPDGDALGPGSRLVLDGADYFVQIGLRYRINV